MAAQKLCATDPVPPREPHWCQYCCSPCWLTRWVATLASHQLQPIVTHNVSNMVVAVWEASMAPHIACFAHTVNLAAQKLLDIPQVQRLLGRIRRVVSFFHKSTMATHLCENRSCSANLATNLSVMLRHGGTVCMIWWLGMLSNSGALPLHSSVQNFRSRVSTPWTIPMSSWPSCYSLYWSHLKQWQ